MKSGSARATGHRAAVSLAGFLLAAQKACRRGVVSTAIIRSASRIRDRSRVRGWLAECKQTRKILKFWLFDLPDGRQMHFTFLACQLYTQKVKIGPVPAPTVPAATCRIGATGLRIPKFTRQRQLGNTAVKPLAPAYDANWVPTWAGWVPGWVTVGYQGPWYARIFRIHLFVRSTPIWCKFCKFWRLQAIFMGMRAM